MRRNSSFIRKVIYIAAIALLLIPLSYLSQPATSSGTVPAVRDETVLDGGQQVPRRGGSGGKLAQLRHEYKLSQANLGEIDPASETMKLATLGMKGIAVNMLWHQANEYKKKKMWDKLAVTVKQITKLQPNFETVWEFQSHNLAYNVSAQFDNYEHRYHWVKKGLDFLMEGTKYNSSAHRLFWYTGWIVGQKIGRSDEYKEFRQMFKEETDYRIKLANYVLDRIDELPLVLRTEFDNWLMSHLWFSKAQDLALLPRAKPLKMSKPVFFQSAAKALINYATAIGEEVRPEINGITQQAWQIGSDAWREFGDFEIRTPWDTVVALNRMETAELRVAELREQLDTDIGPGARDEIAGEKRAALRISDPKLLAAYDRRELSQDPDSLPGEVLQMAHEAETRLSVSDTEVTARAPRDRKTLAEEVLAKIQKAKSYAENIRRYRQHVNFEYWKLRCEAESGDEMVLARQAIFDARQLRDEFKYTRVEKLDEQGKLIPELDENGRPLLDEQGEPVYQMVDGARQKYEKAWDHWHALFYRPDKKYTSLTSDMDTYELMIPIEEYRTLLDPLGEKELPIDFKLLPLLTAEVHERHGLPTRELVIAYHTGKPRAALDLAAELAQQGNLKSEPKLDESGEPIPRTDTKTGKPILDKDGKPVLEMQIGARETFEDAFAQWAALFEKGPAELIEHPGTDTLATAIAQYREVVKKLGEPDIPLDFPLMEFLTARAGHGDLPSPEEIRAAHAGPQASPTNVETETPDGANGDKSSVPPMDKNESTQSGSSEDESS